MFVVYIFGDAEYPNICKIGYDSNWPEPPQKAKKVIRYEQARSHNPREVIIHGIWVYETKEAMKDAEKKMHALLGPYRRTVAHGREWFDVSCQNAVQKIKETGIVDSQPSSTPQPSPMDRAMPYDDWRDPSDVYKGEVYKRLLWVFQEDNDQNRIKVIHSPLFDTCYRYAFTYNPFPVYLVAAFHHPFHPKFPTKQLRVGNETVEKCWHEIVSDNEYGPGISATHVGWLRKGATLAWVAQKAQSSGLVQYDLQQPKPACVRPSDAQIPSIAVGDKWVKRVRMQHI